MSDDNVKKPKGPPQSPSGSDANDAGQAPDSKDNSKDMKDIPSSKNDENDLPSEDTLSNAGSDRTSIINISDLTSTISRVPARIVPVIIVSSGTEQGRIISLAQYKSILVGRDKECELRVYDPSCSRKHVEIFVDDNQRVFLKDLGSTNGSKLNGKRLEKESAIEIKDGDRIQLGDATNLRHTLMPEQDARVQMDVYFRATRDRLTNAFNRHHFDEALDREVSYQRRTGHGLGILFFDVDHFKRINDTFGHPGGDEVLREIGTRVPTVIRNEDIFARVGGEEFGILVRNDTLEGMRILAERLRLAMEKKSVDFEGREVWFTVSVGLTLITGNHDLTATNLFQLADDALYEAKNAGRNRVVVKNAFEK